MKKSEARRIYKQQRQTLSQKALNVKQDLLLIQFQQMDFSQTHFIGSYFPKESQSEPNSLLLTKYLKFLIPSLELAYPVINAIDCSSQLIPLSKYLELISFDIPYFFSKNHSCMSASP